MREKQTQREAAMDKEEHVFTTIEDLIRYLIIPALQSQ